MASIADRQEVSLKPTVAVLYGDASSAALVDAIKQWRKDYAPSEPYETLLAQHVKAIDVHTNILPGGTARTTVRITAKIRARDDSYWYEATMSAGKMKLEKITD